MERITIPSFAESAKNFDFMALARMQADTVNSQPGDLKGYNCPKCMNRGFNMIVRENGTLAARVCSCDSIRRRIRKMERSGLQPTIQEKHLDAFEATQPWQRTLLEGAKEFAANPKGWFFIGGQPGCGKTHLCTGICRELLLRGMEVVYSSWREEISLLKNYKAEGSIREDRLRELKTAQVLYIDDFLKSAGIPTPAEIAIAFELINYRYQNGGITLLSSEYDKFTLTDLDEAMSSRIIESAGTHMYGVKKDRARNYRLRQGAEG